MKIRPGDKFRHGSDGVVVVLAIDHRMNRVFYENEMATTCERSLSSFADEVEPLDSETPR